MVDYRGCASGVVSGIDHKFALMYSNVHWGAPPVIDGMQEVTHGGLG